MNLYSNINKTILQGVYTKSFLVGISQNNDLIYIEITTGSTDRQDYTNPVEIFFLGLHIQGGVSIAAPREDCRGHNN